MIKRKKVLNYIIAVSLVITLSLISVADIISSNNPCSECHRRKYEYCTLLPEDTFSYLPSEIGKNEDVKISVEITGGGRTFFYKIDILRITLKSLNGIVEITQPTQEMHNLYPGNKVVFSWQVKGLKNGTDTLVFTLYAHNPHKNSEFHDTYSYNVKVVIDDTKPPNNPGIEPSTWTIIMDHKRGELALHVNMEVNNIVIEPPAGIKVQPQQLEKARPGEEIKLVFEAIENKEINDNAIIRWNENGEKKEIKVLIVYQPPVKNGRSLEFTIGRYTGLFSMILLIISMLFGGVAGKKAKEVISSLIGARNRIRAHCIISWLLLSLSLLHGVVLLLNPYSNQFWNPKIVLGDLSFVAMLIVSINGSFMKQIVKKLGKEGWRKIHSLYSWTAFILGIIHAILIGTDFEFVRHLVGL